MVAALIMGAAIRPRPLASRVATVIPGWREATDPEFRARHFRVRRYASPRNDACQITGLHGAGTSR